MKQILLYYPIYTFIAEEFINQLSEVPKEEDVTVRLNCPGGSVFAGWGLIAALKERTGKSIVKVDGNASSMAFFMTLYFDKVEALDVTKFMVHRATGRVDNEDDQKILDDVNADLRKAMEKRLNSEQFEKIVGITIKELFEGKDRRDVWLTAKQAKKIGLVHKVRRLEPLEIAAMKESLVALSSFEDDSQGSEEGERGSSAQSEEKAETDNDNNNKKTEKKMTVAELKEKHPELYAQIFEAGINQEKDRAQAWLAFNEVDMEAVKSGIEKGENVTQKIMAEMSVKMMSKVAAGEIEEDSPGDIDTSKKEDKEETAEDKALAEAEKVVLEAAGVGTKKTDEQ